MINEEVKTYLKYMKNSLERRELKTVLSEAPEKQFSSHKVRSNENENPLWYRELCNKYPKERKVPRKRKNKFTDSKVCRRDLKAVLNRLIAKGKSCSKYRSDLIEQAEKYIETEKELEELQQNGDYQGMEQLQEETGYNDLFY